jgi:hypothetical protein
MQEWRKEKERAASRAVAFFNNMKDLYATDHLLAKEPSLISYATGINAIGSCLELTAPEMAERRTHSATQVNFGVVLQSTFADKKTRFSASA